MVDHVGQSDSDEVEMKKMMKDESQTPKKVRYRNTCTKGKNFNFYCINYSNIFFKNKKKVMCVMCYF